MQRLFPTDLSSCLGVCALILALGGCSGGKLGNFDTPDGGGSKLTALLGLDKEKSPSTQGIPGKQIFCPDIIILEGTEATRLYAGSPPSNANLRVQYSLEDVARECSLRDDKIVLKVGIAGKVLLGPAGSAGSFTVPVRIAVVRKSDHEPVVSKLFRATATIGAGKTEESFTIISEPISVPFIQDHAEENYTIKAGIDTAEGAEPAPGGNRKR